MRGVGNYNEAGIRLFTELMQKNIPASIFGSDAHLHALEREGVKGFSNLFPQMRSRNKKAFDELVYNAESRAIIFADMNKMESYFEPYIDEAKQVGIDNIFIWNVQDRNMEKPLQRCLFSHTVRHKMQIENIKATELTKYKIPQVKDTKEEDNLPKMLNSILEGVK